MWLRIETNGDHGNEPSGYIKDGGFLDLLNDFSLSRRAILLGIAGHNFQYNYDLNTYVVVVVVYLTTLFQQLRLYSVDF
jgi:hypothetical protein